MDKVVTMQSKGITQDKDGKWGIWRTLPQWGKIFIFVGETAETAIKRRRRELLAMPPKQYKVTIYQDGTTNIDLAMWYQKLGEYKRGGYFDMSANGDIYIPIGNKLIVTGGTYEAPIRKKVIFFKDEEDMFEWIQDRRRKNDK